MTAAPTRPKRRSKANRATQLPLLDDITPILAGSFAGLTGRRWTVELPPGLTLLNANDRDSHWGRRSEATKKIREAAGWATKAAKVPQLAKAHVLAVIRPPTRARRDAANSYPSVKAAVDGIVDAGVLQDDSTQYLDGPDMRLGQVVRGGQLVLVITDLGVAA